MIIKFLPVQRRVLVQETELPIPVSSKVYQCLLHLKGFYCKLHIYYISLLLCFCDSAILLAAITILYGKLNH